MKRRSVLKGTALAGITAVFGYGVGENLSSQKPPIEGMGYVKLDEAPQNTRKDGKVLTNINGSFYWINLDKPSIEPVEETND